MDIRISSDRMKEVDREVAEKYGIAESRLMENAGLRVAEFIRQKIDGRHVTLYAGEGNNGGDALVAARRLHLWNYEVEVVLASGDLSGLAGEELEILENLDVEINKRSSKKDFGVAIDGLLGYGIVGEPRPPYESMIKEINRNDTVVSVDIPTGVDPDTGEKPGAFVKPDYTVTLGMPFKGMKKENSGGIWVADISVPAEAYGDKDKYRIFNQKSIVDLSRIE